MEETRVILSNRTSHGAFQVNSEPIKSNQSSSFASIIEGFVLLRGLHEERVAVSGVHCQHIAEGELGPTAQPVVFLPVGLALHQVESIRMSGNLGAVVSGVMHEVPMQEHNCASRGFERHCL